MHGVQGDPGGLRERKRTTTAAALRGAAVRLTAERGLAGVTVEDIAATAGVSTRTFFNYFACKEDALVLPGAGLGDRVAEALAARPPGEPIVRAVQRSVLGLLDRFDPPPERREDWVLRARLIESHPDSLLPRQLAAYARFEATLATAIAERTGTDVDADVVPGLLAAVVAAAARSAMVRWCHTPDSSLAALLEESLDAIASGFSEPIPPKP